MAQRNRRRQRRRGGLGVKLLLVGAALLFTLGLGVLAVTSWVLGVAADAPSLSSCKKPKQRGNTVLFAADGSRLGLVAAAEAHAPVPISRIPRTLQLATVAIEDRRFFEHGGVDYEAIIRAAKKDLEAGRVVEGGSTITQQLVRKLCIRNPERTLERKIVEVKLAEEYAERHSRREILDQYLNSASYGTVEGATAIGVGAAAKVYFGKPVWKLDPAQAALLAGLPQAPSEYNPLLHPGRARARRNEVLVAMAEQGYLSPRRAAALARRGLRLAPSGSYFAHREPYFFDYVEDELLDRYGADAVRNGGLRVYTTIEPKLQEVGLEAMRSALPYSTDPASALVSIEPGSGEIEAMVSSSSYGRSK
ncbi:MAG TPA: transglycosylase domain-containing protein, partial [Solirubrobacterales bacterium]|nr:transglycosylase domain-containing protein [Solirubrobacterales bacterium]